ncbi:LytTR family transcriptional regulator DNA-binding domain-containing protein [Ekhidna sp.]|uniref:LytTR family transcriptional regulator DNA-binding domain-containing protein n=1 Tax=Ekhidna sp. TaxID=2608089 RepID=UPI003B5CD85F
MKLKNPFFRLSHREQKIHAIIWIIIFIAINIPEWAIVLGPFHSDDYSLFIPSLYGIVLKTYLFYGSAFKFIDQRIKNFEKRLGMTIQLFVGITLIEFLLDTGYYTLHYWKMDLTTFTEILMGQSLLNFVFFYLPSLMFGFTRAIYIQEPKTSESELMIEDKGKKVNIPMSKLTHVESKQDHCILYAGDRFMIHQSLEEIQSELPDSFKRCHESFIVNTQLIDKQLGKELVVGGFIIPIDSRYRENLKLTTKQDMLHPIA